jgi:hypothetical protein
MRLPILSEEAFNALDRWALLSECKKEREQCCGSGSGAILTLDPESGLRNRFFWDPGFWIPDPGSQIPDPKPIFFITNDKLLVQN